MAFFIPYDQFIPLLNSKNENTVKNALQEIFELLVNGCAIARTKSQSFIQDIRRLVNSSSNKIRKWVYHCACFYQDQAICQAIKSNLIKEQSYDNIIWALRALSKMYSSERELRLCTGQRHEEFMEMISKQYIRDSLVLFGGVVDINPKTILLTNNSTDLQALATIYAYDGLVHGLYSDVTDSVMRAIENHDDPHVREYAYWGQVLRNTKRTLQNEQEDSNPGVQKWKIALQIQNGNEDFVVSALKPLSLCSETVSLDVKNGVIRGLNSIPYNIKYVPFIHRWFANELEETVIFQLLNYFIANCSLNRKDATFFYALEDALQDKSLSQYIVDKIKNNNEYGLKVTKNGENYVLDYTNRGETIMQKVNIEGSGHTIAVANDNSSATITLPGSQINELEKLIQNVRIQAKAELSEEDQEKVDGILAAIEHEAKLDHPKKPFIKMLLDGLNGIKNAVQFGAAVTTLIQFFEK